MTAIRQRLAVLPLRTRLAMLTALAVALAVAVCSLAAWFVAREQLIGSLDDSLQENRPSDAAVISSLQRGCSSEPEESSGGEFPGVVRYTIQVAYEGGRCVLSGDTALTVTDTELAVADGKDSQAVHNVTTADGQTYRALTVPLSGVTLDGHSAAVTIARPLDEVNDSLRSLALVLALVVAAGAVGAAGVGVFLARAGLRPVNRLTDAAEHIARTEDLSVRIPVEGDDQDEIARLSRAFNSMTGALASSRDLQQQLIADAGHELRTPLTSLRTNVELLVRSEEAGRPLPEDDKRRLLVSVTAQLTELATLIGDLQELSRPQPAPGGTTDVVPLHDVARRAVARARLRAGALKIIDELDPWYVRGEAAALERAVVNLLDNAVKFGGGAAEGVSVVLRSGVLTVRDHGPGIPDEELPHVFERFWRSPGARALPGSGLGLSIVARTVMAHGGEVTLGPAAGSGTQAVVILPGAPQPPPQPPPDVPADLPADVPPDRG